MSLSIYKIMFKAKPSELDDLYEYFSEVDKEKLYDLDAYTYYDYVGVNGNYSSFIITTPKELNNYIEILNDNYIKVDYINISKQVLSNELDLEIDIKHLVDSDTELKFEFFIDDLNNWIIENLDIDLVLDRISEVGMDGLKEVEKEFLKKYKI